MRRFLSLSLLFVATSVLAAPVETGEAETENKAVMPAPEPPELPAPVRSGEQMEPDETVIEIKRNEKNETVQEFRRNGKLYMKKITPAAGPAYYLIDKDGDGVMDVKRSDLEKNIDINQWPLLEWD